MFLIFIRKVFDVQKEQDDVLGLHGQTVMEGEKHGAKKKKTEYTQRELDCLAALKHSELEHVTLERRLAEV